MALRSRSKNLITFPSSGDILKTLFNSSYIRPTLAKQMLNLLSYMVQSMVACTVCWFVSTNKPYFDFFFHIILSVLIVINTKYIFSMMHKYIEEMEVLVEYFILNWNFENKRRWKRIFVLCISVYLLIYVSIFEITSRYIVYYILQWLACFFLLDAIETRGGLKRCIGKFLDKILDKFLIKTRLFEQVDIIENYHKQEEETLDIVEKKENVVGENIQKNIQEKKYDIWSDREWGDKEFYFEAINH